MGKEFFFFISNEITGPFLGSVVKMAFRHTRKGEETTTAALTSLKFPFLQRQESQRAVQRAVAHRSKWVCVVCVCGAVSVCIWLKMTEL